MCNQETWQEAIERIPRIPVPKIIASEPLSSGRYIQLSQKTIEYPNGTRRSWEGQSRPQEVISVLAKTRDNVLILIAEYRPLIAPYWNISLTAWLVDEWYSKEDTCRKELLEETGYRGDHVKFLVHTAPSPGGSTEIISQYYIGDAVSDPRGQCLEPTETIEVLRVPIQEYESFMGVVSDLPDIFTIDAKIDQAVNSARRRGYFSMPI